jgi:hypothetical protein
VIASGLAVILLPATMLGCVYYPWSALHSIRWLQIAVLFNPMVYMSEGLRAVLTPGVGHLAMWAILLVLIGGAGHRLPGHPHLPPARTELATRPPGPRGVVPGGQAAVGQDWGRK